MYKQTLCVTLPMSAAVIIVAALFANAGDLDPPKGPIEPTMHTLQEIYDLVAETQPACPACIWQPKHVTGSINNHVPIVSGPGILHKVLVRGGGTARLMDGVIGNPSVKILEIVSSEPFFEVDVSFDEGLWVDVQNGGITLNVLYRSTNP